jgi:O-antigen/teichoic acid export membrane protein
MRLDVLLIKKLLVHGDYENGVFASGGRLLEAANMMMGTIALILLPLFAKQIAEKTAIKPILNLLQSVIILPAIVFSIICSVFASEIIHFVSPESNNYTADVFSVLILSFIPFAISHIYGTLLTAKAEIKLLILLSFTALLINLTMNFYLIPKQGAMGAAWSVLTTQMVSGFGSMLLAIKRMKINTSIYESARILLFPFICFILGEKSVTSQVYISVAGNNSCTIISNEPIFVPISSILFGLYSFNIFIICQKVTYVRLAIFLIFFHYNK